MPKRALTLRVHIPNFVTDSRAWRRGINEAIATAQADGRVRYGSDDKLEVEICFYLSDRKLTILDVDNRAKDVLDALQGFIGDKGKQRILTPIIPNDNQVYRLLLEKRLPPKANREAQSTITIRKYTHHAKTARTAREHRKHVPLPQ